MFELQTTKKLQVLSIKITNWYFWVSIESITPSTYYKWFDSVLNLIFKIGIRNIYYLN